MNENEAGELFEKLLSTLRERREDQKPDERDDYLKAIEAEIDAGKPVQVKLKLRGETSVNDPVVGGRQSGATSSGEFIQRQDYTAREKLAILVNGLALATIAPPLMARKFVEIVAGLSDQGADTRLQMGDDQTNDPRRTIDEQSISIQVEQTAMLGKLLAEVRHALDGRSSPIVGIVE